MDFLKGEVRYTSLYKAFPAEAEVLSKEAVKNAQWRYKSYQRMAAMDFTKSE
jgi:pyruvate-ferredoxin/flavodoxin oxidoreductase